VSAAAIDALGALARPSEFPAAVDAREDEFTRELLEAAARDLSDPDRGIVVLALSKMLERSDGRDPNAVAALTTWFAISPETALDTVIRWLDAPHRLGQQTATGLLQQLANGDPILDRVIDQLEPIEAEHTELYLDMAAKHGGATVRRIVERAVDESRDLANRLLAIRALGRTSLPPEAVDTLLELAALERDARRTAAREALKTARGPVTDRVCQRLTDPEWEIRAEAARTLGVRGATDRIGQLLAALEDENGRVRTSTWAAIGEIATGADYGELCTRLFKTRTSREREHASRAIALVARRYPVDPAGDIDRSITLNGPGGHRFRAPLGDWQTVGSVSLQSQSPRRLNAEAGSGVLTNGETGRTRHLVSDVEHGSISAHVEFLVPKGSNSGVYFMGRYEIQILDSHGKSKVSFSDCGGIYQRNR